MVTIYRLAAPKNIGSSCAPGYFKPLSTPSAAVLLRDPRKVEDVKAELLQSEGQDSRSARNLKDLDQKLSAFVDDFAGRPIHEITTPEFDRWIRSLNASGTARNSYKRALGVLFGFAVRVEYSLKNPARGIEKASEQTQSPEF